MLSGPDGVIETDVPARTTIEIVLLVAVAGDTQDAFEVIIHLTRLPLVSADVEKAELLIPALVPLICH
jgi:hypothetical protein